MRYMTREERRYWRRERIKAVLAVIMFIAICVLAEAIT